MENKKTPLSKNELLYQWADSFSKRFPKRLSEHLLRALYLVCGCSAPCFFQERSAYHCKRLLVMTAFLQKKIEEKIGHNEDNPVCIDAFVAINRLCIAVAYPKRENLLSEETILEIASQKIPTLSPRHLGHYHWICPSFPYAICYVELEKTRGLKLSKQELKMIKAHLKEQMPGCVADFSIFWPYNHEETFKQLLILEKEISSPDDYPQVSVRFQKQTSAHLEFLICIVRPKRHLLSNPTIETSSFPLSTRLICHVHKELGCQMPCLAEAFSLTFPLKNFQSGNTINLLEAREFVSQLLSDAIGAFRDYNGGLFETQKSRFTQLTKQWASTIPKFSLFGKDLFYALEPIEAQVCLKPALFKDLFTAFSACLQKKLPFVYRLSPFIVIVGLEKTEQSDLYIQLAKKLRSQGKITAYGEVTVLSKNYFCFVDSAGSYLKNIDFNVDKKEKVKNPHHLYLTFQAKIPSLSPYYLAREIRGRILAKLLFEGLFRLEPSLQFTFGDCKSFTVSQDKRVYVFKLRSNAIWSNGEKVRASHYESAWKRNFSAMPHLDLFYGFQNARAIKENRAPIDALGVKAVDERSLEVVLEQDDPSFLEKLTHPLFFPSLGSFSEPKFFNGPYFPTKKTGVNLILERNPYFWDRKNIFFEAVAIRLCDAAYTIDLSRTEDEMDWVGTPCFFNIDFSLLKKQEEIFFPFVVHFNTEHFPLSSPHIRSALGAVIDREWISQKIFSQGKPTYTLLAHDRTPPLTLEQAKKLFSLGLNQLGLTKNTFPPLTISSVGIATHKNLANYLQKRWQSAFGIRIDLDVQTCSNQFYQKIEQGNFHIGGFFQDIFPADLFPFFQNFSAKKTNYSRFSHPKYREMIELIRHAKTLEEKHRRLIDAEKFLLDQAPVVFLSTLTHHYVHRSGLSNYVVHHDGSIDFRFASLKKQRIKQKLAWAHFSPQDLR